MAKYSTYNVMVRFLIISYSANLSVRAINIYGCKLCIICQFIHINVSLDEVAAIPEVWLCRVLVDALQVRCWGKDCPAVRLSLQILITLSSYVLQIMTQLAIHLFNINQAQYCAVNYMITEVTIYFRALRWQWAIPSTMSPRWHQVR